MINDMYFKSEQEFESLANYMTESGLRLGFASEGSCYLLNDKVIKYFDGIPHQDYTKEQLLQFKNLNVGNYYFAKAILYVADELKGYIMDYSKGKNLGRISLSNINKSSLLKAGIKIQKNTSIISEKGICAMDLDRSNILFDKDNSNFNIIDTCEFYINDDDFKNIYNENIKSINLQLIKSLLTKYDIDVIKNYSELYKLIKYKSEITDFNYFVELLFKCLSDYCDKKITTIDQYRKFYRKKV